MDFAVPTDHRVKSKKKQKDIYIYIYIALIRDLKKIKNMKVMVIPIVTGALGTIIRL